MGISNTTQTSKFNIRTYDTKCRDNKCRTTIEATPLQDFCSATGSTAEFVFVTISVGHLANVTVKYFVPCACECSLKVDTNSATCNGHGDLSCGACKCHPEWYVTFNTIYFSYAMTVNLVSHEPVFFIFCTR